MDVLTIKKLESIAPKLHEFLELDKAEREWLLPMLARSIRDTIKLLEIIESEPKTYEDLANEVGLHFNTVKQKLLALKRGGFPIFMDESVAVCETGRRRVLSRRFNDQDIVKFVEKGLMKNHKVK